MNGMAGGQMLDIEAEAGAAQTLDSIIRIQAHKTGALFRFACEAGAIMAGADRAPLRRYADDIGLAFQITDDLLDLESNAATARQGNPEGYAKRQGDDCVADGARGGAEKAESLVASAIAALAPYGEKADTLREAARFIVSRKK